MSTQLTKVNAIALSEISEESYSPQSALRKELRLGLIIVAILVFGLGGLAALIPITGAVIAPGTLNVASFVKEIAHPTGGVVADIMVRDGDHVKRGQPLMRLDDTVSGAASSYSGESLDQMLAAAARLKAERDGLAGVAFPPELTRRANDPEVAVILEQEQKAFQLRRSTRQGQRAQLGQQIRQIEADIAGSASQAESNARQAALIEQELKVTRDLYDQHYTTLDRLNALERSAVSLRANAASARTSAQSGRARIAELQTQIASIDRDAKTAAANQLTELENQITSSRREKVAADDTYDKSIIRAPQAGIIDKLAFKTVGGVVPAGQTLMEIVPDGRMVVEVRIPVNDIDQVYEGQKAMLRFSAFSTRTTPEIEGALTHVSADRVVEQYTGVTYYRGTVDITQAHLAELEGLALKPGMPVEAFLQTNDRTMISYILKPLADQLRRAFREG